MVRSALSKMAWVGRTASMVFGLALVMALVVGVASMALAGTGVGDTFNLGRLNTVNQISRLVGKTDNPMLRVDNNNAGSNATALDLQVEPGHAPMSVNSTTRVAGLNADQLDGKDASQFVANSTYRLGQGEEEAGTLLDDGTRVMNQQCLAGDRMISGGLASVNKGSVVLDSYPSDVITWTARINPVAGDNWTVVVLCADQ